MNDEETGRDEVELARLFGLVHRGTQGDVDFYVAETLGAMHVLELGAGTGRVLAPIAHAGTPITGIERSAAMIAAGRTARVDALPAHARVLLGDMRSFSLRERFDRVIIPYNSLFALESDADVARALACAYEHLEPGGRLIFDCYVLEEGTAVGSPTAFRKVGSVIDSGRRIDVFEQEGPELPGRRFEMRYRYKVHGTGSGPREVTDTVRHHFIPPEMLLSMVTDAGFLVMSVSGDFDQRPYDSRESSIVVVRAVKDHHRPRTSTLNSACMV